ncbi:glycosyltransferase family 4 protein [Sphaerimonospora thailandensis]|uniref:Glycosyl transferase n=1 Tax=Sphaerimonospora thailandensis TaxID=795644 RepID=A0A8J3W1F3_9ACTN|nr:glycosyltransferase family 4 protein [Sphaerimonospora thailandensis]GIH73264.1 glycosyl transferase [Sphaerimonospora thailandensis]
MKPDNRIRVMEIIARMNVGGPATQVAGLCERLDSDEFDHRLYAGHVDGGEGDHLNLRDTVIPVHRIPGLGRSVRPADYRALRRLVAAMREFRPHIVHTRTGKAGALGRLAVRLSGVDAARIHVFHTPLPRGRPSRLRRSLRVRPQRFVAARFVAAGCDRLVTGGFKVRDDLLSAGVGRLEQYVVIPPGVQLGPIPDRMAARRSLGIPADVPVVAYVGRLSRVKRPDRFVEVAREVLERMPDCRFLVCGGGELREEVERAIRPVWDSFRLLGWRRDVETVYAAADVLLLTSDNEGTPLALVEAGMAGVPVVSTRMGSVDEVVRDRRTGLLADPDVAELTDHTVRLLKDPSLARRMGEAARRWTTRAFGVDRLVTDTEALYRSLCGVPR